MKAITTTLRIMATGAGRKLLVGVTDEPIPAGATLTLVKIDGDRYELRAAVADQTGGRGDQILPVDRAQTYRSPKAKK